MEIIDLSQEIYAGMPTFNGLPEVKMSVHATHEQWEGLENATTATPSVYKLEMGEHTGTHVDGINHMGRQYHEQSIEALGLFPLRSFQVIVPVPSLMLSFCYAPTCFLHCTNNTAHQ